MPVVVKVEGLSEFRKVLREVAPDLGKSLQKALRASVAPVVADARGRLSSLPGTGPRTAKNVRSSVTSKGVAVELVQRGGYELAREFGAKGAKTTHYTRRGSGGSVQVTRTFNYANPNVFDTWTGNRFTLDAGVSGRGLFPAAAAGGARAVAAAQAALDEALKKLGN